MSHFKADTNYANIFADSGSYLSELSLVQLEQKLPDNFLRVHKKIISNKDVVKDVQKYFNS